MILLSIVFYFEPISMAIFLPQTCLPASWPCRQDHQNTNNLTTFFVKFCGICVFVANFFSK
jgi:hypothetical protein